MPSNKNIAQLSDLKTIFSKATAVYFTGYQGLNVASITKLRSKFFQHNIDFKVAKNSLLRIVVDESKLTGLDNILKGDTAIAISYDEPIIPAKILKDFIEDNDLPVVKGIIIDGKVIQVEMFQKLSKMESKEVMLGQLVSMLNNPLQKLVSTLSSPMQNTLGALINLQNKS